MIDLNIKRSFEVPFILTIFGVSWVFHKLRNVVRYFLGFFSCGICEECNKLKLRRYTGGLNSIHQRNREICLKCDKFLCLPEEEQLKIKRNRKLNDILR